MGNLWATTKESPPLMVLVLLLFDFRPLFARTKFYQFKNCKFFFFFFLKKDSEVKNCVCKMAMQDAGIFVQLVWEIGFEMLFEDYFNEAKHFSTRITLKPIDDPHVDLIATLSPPYQCLLFILLISELVNI